jgi:hypothetical protein
MTDHARIHRNICVWALAASLAGELGCRTSVEDVHRWANTQQGPRKIVAVMTHDKYPDELRIEAALTLVRMKPRSGRRVGIDDLVAGLGDLPAPSRAKIVGGMVPVLEKEIRKPPPPEPEPDTPREVDTTFPYKDAAFALLTTGAELVGNASEREHLEGALTDWVMADFSARMDDPSQAYGMGQVLAELGADGVRRLPELLVPEAKKINSISQLISDLGDPETKLAASERLVELARDVASDGWRERKAPMLAAANAASGHKVEGARFDAQLAMYQEEELLRMLASLKQIGQAPAVDYLLSLATDKAQSEKRRDAALAAMEGHMDRKNEAQVARLLSLAGANDTPDSVRDQALRRVGELPRQQVAPALYGLFSHKNWKVRWVAAELVLKMSEIVHLDEFMNKLASVRQMAITEPIRYGELIAALPGTPPVRDVIGAYAREGRATPVRLAALGYYLARATQDQLATLEVYATDSSRVPDCAKGAEGCEWRCEVSNAGQQVTKDVRTIGDYVRYCVKPAILTRLAAATAPQGGAEKTAKN